MRPHKLWPTFALASVLVAGVMAGCVGQTQNASNKAPTAHLAVEPKSGWTGDTFAFDGRDSSDPDGHVVRWLFDFGDGSTHTANTKDDARVEHIYARGSQYVATLTVTDDGGASSGAQTDTTTFTVIVNERMRVAQQALSAVNVTQGARSDMPVNVTAGADRFELDADLQSLVLVGQSQVTVSMRDPSGHILAQRQVTLDAGSRQHVYLNGTLGDKGDYTLRLQADSGGASMNGELRVIYG